MYCSERKLKMIAIYIIGCFIDVFTIIICCDLNDILRTIISQQGQIFTFNSNKLMIQVVHHYPRPINYDDF